MKRILFYSDSKYLGGHELQTVNALKYLQNSFDIVFIVYSGNTNFIDFLKELNIKIIEIDYCSTRFQILRTFVSFGHIYYLYKIIKQIQPNIILNIQGNIEFGSVMILVAKFVKYRSITYIPSCHFLSEVTNNGLIARVKDFVNILYYNLVNEFITINDFNKRLILQRGVKSKIHTVPNGIEFDKYKIYNKNKARKMLNLLEEKINIALVGRVQLWNKGHDILLKMVNKYKNELKNYKFIIVGTGEDLESFGQQVKELGLVEYFTFLGHQRDLSAVYSAIDGIIIPSRFEAGAGTPMVLLEALYYKLPIVMTNLPDMDAYLPINSLFKKGNVDDFFEKIITIDAKIISESKRNEIVVKHSLDNFQKEFEKVILKHE